MISWFKQHKAWLWLFCIVLLTVRVSDAHWHLCYDGNEPPRTVHIGDVAASEQTEPGHTDTDLNLVDSGVFKQLEHAGDMPALLAAIALLCIFFTAPQSAPIPYRTPCYPTADYRRIPPPRGPPH